MKCIYALVEQLDLALEQLAVGTPPASRFALILVDNAVELVLHTSCETEIMIDDARGHWLPKRYDVKRRAKALGQHFSPKVEFCVSLDLLSRREAEFIRAVHDYRNELYHSGVRYDEVILPLAWEYFGTAVDLLPRIRVGGYLLIDAESPRVAKHFGGKVWAKPPEERIRDVAETLRAARQPLPKAFAAMLSQFAVKLVEEARDNLEFLANDNPHGWDEGRVLFELQLHHYAFVAVDGLQLSPSNLPPGLTVFQRLDQLREQWRPPVRTSPIPRWLERAENIGIASDSYEALARFEVLRRDMQELSELLREAAQALDTSQQLELDHYMLMQARTKSQKPNG